VSRDSGEEVRQAEGRVRGQSQQAPPQSKPKRLIRTREWVSVCVLWVSVFAIMRSETPPYKYWVRHWIRHTKGFFFLYLGSPRRRAAQSRAASFSECGRDFLLDQTNVRLQIGSAFCRCLQLQMKFARTSGGLEAVTCDCDWQRDLFTEDESYANVVCESEKNGPRKTKLRHKM